MQDENYDVVESKFYKLEENDKTYLGQQTTLISQDEGHYKITVLENGKI